MIELPKRHEHLRLKTWNYKTPGKYFITISCFNKISIFDNKTIRQACIDIFNSNASVNNIKVNIITIALDHIHAIIELNEKSVLNLSQYLGKVKVRITQHLRKNGQASLSLRGRNYQQIWQRSFYDHVIRNEQDFLEKAKYIENHPYKEEGNIFTQQH